MKTFFFVSLFLFISTSTFVKSYVTNTTWGLLAWGFDGGGKDTITSSIKVVDIDLFDQKSLIPQYKAQGHDIVCYFSAGSWEAWRPDANDPNWEFIKIGKMGGWDELWLDVRNMTALKIVMGNRIDLAKSSGCDAIEPDNIDCFDNSECWKSMKNPTVSSSKAMLASQLTYNQWLATYAHSKGMKIGMKNAIDIIPDLVSTYDFAVNEQCQAFNECSAYSPFVKLNKAVFNVEYHTGSTICSSATKSSTQTKYCQAQAGSGNLCAKSTSWTNCF